ncbi:hypothetical protein BCD64_22590 [Nostoc sp. MBR 210]|nr:hypothetical protein BCD64_22590 [Nostoc sp. MBR 210]
MNNYSLSEATIQDLDEIVSILLGVTQKQPLSFLITFVQVYRSQAYIVTNPWFGNRILNTPNEILWFTLML